MNIGVLSGKGGTGKTFISTNLANVIQGAHYIDCDIEEPNGHLFFKMEDTKSRKVNLSIPVVDQDQCIACRKCVDFCKFSALSLVGQTLYVLEDLCHSCGACSYICPSQAISEKDREIGRVVWGNSGATKVYSGFMNLGESSGTAIIDSLLDMVRDLEGDKIVDCPPGAACTVMDSIRDSDYCLVVAEASIFGLANLRMIVQLLDIFKTPFGLVINKSLGEDKLIREYARANDIDILLEIPYDKELARVNAQAELISSHNDSYRKIFQDLYLDIRRRLNEKTIGS